MSLSQLEQESKFKKHLSEYWSSKGITQIKIPQIGGQQLNLFKLYKAVCKKGGGQAVSHNKLWKEIVDEFGLPSTCTSASFTLKNHYQKYLLGYQQRFFFGKDDNADLPQLVAGRQRKPMKDGQNIIISNRFYRQQGQYNNQSSTLANQLKKFYQKSDPNQHINFIKRTKMYPVMSQVKHMILSLLSYQQNQITYGINMLLLFSMNTQAPFLFTQYPNVLQSVAQFIQKHYPATRIVDLQYLRTITVAIRNLLINHKNIQPFIESNLVEVLTKIFQNSTRTDRQLVRNLSDIFSSLSRIGWETKDLFQIIEKSLDKDTHQDLETGIDLLRSLVEQKQQACEDLLKKKIDFFTRCLLHSSIQIRESILEIFAYITEKSQTTRLLCLKNIKFMERLFALMSTSIGIFQKQAQLSCLIINNISQLSQSPLQQNRNTFLSCMKLFQKNLALISFNDQSLSPIICSILFLLSGRVSSSVGKDQDNKQKLLSKMRKNIDRDRVSSDQQIQEQQQEQQQEQDDEEGIGQQLQEEQQEQQLQQQEELQEEDDIGRNQNDRMNKYNNGSMNGKPTKKIHRDNHQINQNGIMDSSQKQGLSSNNNIKQSVSDIESDKLEKQE